MAEKILIFGRGYMAGNLVAYFKDAAQISPADITNEAAVREAIEAGHPAVVINAAGKTNIDWCEDHRVEAVHANVTGPLILLKACADMSVFFCHLGSGCIFDGVGRDGRGFREEDTPNPGCFYGWTKAWADMILREFPVLIARLRMPLSAIPHPRNLLSKLAGYTKIIGDQNSITIIEDFLPALEKLIARRKTGVYHITNPGTMSPYEIALLLKEAVVSDKTIEKIPKQTLDTMTKARRVNTILNTDKLRQEGIVLPPIREAVERAVREFTKLEIRN
jgi:dTDP-4-dehydrorhamnose reductase